MCICIYRYTYTFIDMHTCILYISIFTMHQARMLLAFFEGLIPPKNDNVPWRMLKILVAGGVPAWVLTWRNSRTAQGANGSLASWSLGCWKKLKWCDSGALWYWKMNTMNDQSTNMNVAISYIHEKKTYWTCWKPNEWMCGFQSQSFSGQCIAPRKGWSWTPIRKIASMTRNSLAFGSWGFSPLV